MDTINEWVSLKSFFNAVSSCGLTVLHSLKWLRRKVIGWASTLRRLSSIEYQDFDVSYSPLSSIKHQVADVSSSPEVELLPGLPDDITWLHVVTKIPGTAFQSLSSVNRTWRRAIQTRQVYDARVSSNSRETLVAIRYINSRHMLEVSTYSMKQKALYKLPPVPRRVGRIRSWIFSFISQGFYPRDAGRLVAWNGQLYLVGAYGHEKWSHILDLRAGGKQWKLGKCKDAYSSYNDILEGLKHPAWGLSYDFHPPSKPTTYFKLGEKSYRVRDNDGRQHGRGRDICVSDNDGPWVHQHEIVCDELGAHLKNIHVINAANNELLALADWQKGDGEKCLCLVQSSGFGTDSKKIVWHKGPHSLHFEQPGLVTMCSVLV